MTGATVCEIWGHHSTRAEDWGSNISAAPGDVRIILRTVARERPRYLERGKWRCSLGRVVTDVSKDRNALKWNCYNFSKRRELFAQRQSVTFQKTEMFTATAARAANVSNLSFFPKDLNTYMQPVLQKSHSCVHTAQIQSQLNSGNTQYYFSVTKLVL
jgi:hypothetical protein